MPASAPAPESSARLPDAGPPRLAAQRTAAEVVPDPALAQAIPAAADPVQKTDVRTIAPGASSGLVAFAKTLPAGGLTWVGPLRGNGGRDVLIHVPPGADPDAEFGLVYHFHGTHSEKVAAQQPGMAKKEWVGWDRVQQTVDAITELQAAREGNVALIYPLSAGKRPEPTHTGWFNKEYDRMWMRHVPPTYTDAFDTLHAEVLEILGGAFGIAARRVRPRVIAEGHSAGGIALRSIAEGGTRHVGEYIFLDASFQGWADGCHRAVREHATKAGGEPALVSVVITKGGIADPFGRSDPWCNTTPVDAAAWDRHRAQCEAGATKPAGSKQTCAALREAAELWPLQEPWCEAFARDLQGLPGAYLLRTKVPHGKQPRHFAGGLELPADRFDRVSSAARP